MRLRVLQYNILAKKLVSPAWMPYVDRRVLRWKHRQQHLQTVIRSAAADVICLCVSCIGEADLEYTCSTLHRFLEAQEVDIFDTLGPFLRSIGYESIYRNRPGDKADGCIIAWRSDRLRCTETACVFYDDAGPALVRAGGLDDALARRTVEYYGRRSMAIFAALAPIDPSTRGGVVVGATHMFWNPRHARIKGTQAEVFRLALSEFRQFVRRRAGSAWPVIVAGDFNTMPGGDAHRVMMQPLPRTDEPELDSAGRLAWNRGLTASIGEVEGGEEGGDEGEGRDRWLVRLGQHLRASEALRWDDLLSVEERWDDHSPTAQVAGAGGGREEDERRVGLKSAYSEASRRKLWLPPLPLVLSPMAQVDRELVRSWPDAISTLRDRALRALEAAPSGVTEPTVLEHVAEEPDAVFPWTQEPAEGDEPAFTTWVERFHGRIDYIWAGDAEEEGEEATLELRGAVRLPDETAACVGTKGMPNVAHPSDHLPLVAEYELTRREERP